VPFLPEDAQHRMLQGNKQHFNYIASYRKIKQIQGHKLYVINQCQDEIHCSNTETTKLGSVQYLF